MEPDSKPTAKELFLELEGLPPVEQEARLSACDDPGVVRAVRELLGMSDEADAFFGEVPFAGLDHGDRTGERIGPYAIKSLLGEGGMGSVWLAERVDGEFQQTVAIKILRSHVRDEATKARFRSEREILAGLSHPAIASLYDGGVAPDGRPYFVMEYVDGEPIDEYCAGRESDVEERLRLVLKVCHALEHAHQSGVVHRDVKPANVLVSSTGDVKLLDFGIAKLERGHAAASPFETGTGVTPMTPAYASPEQLRGGDISTATDTYALGVLLYLLLTGELPYEAGADSALGLAQAICDAPVVPPSRRLATRKQASSGLHRRLRGDLDTITLMALRKEPHRRYPNAGALGDDIQRHLDQFPVHARADSLPYRGSRFLARHKHASAIAAVALVAIGISGGATVLLARSNSVKSDKIEAERSGRHELMDHLVGLYESADPWKPGANSETRALLTAAVGRLQQADGGDPEARATLLRAAGRVYSRLADFDRARQLLEESLELRRMLSDGPNPELAATLLELGNACGRGGDAIRGRKLLGEALAMEIALHGDDHPNVGRVRYELAKAQHGGGDAEEQFQEALRIFGLNRDQPSEEHAEALRSRAEYLAVTGKYNEAIALSEEALTIWEKLYGEDHPAYAKTAEGLGMLYCQVGRKDEGIEVLRQALAVNRVTYAGMNHPSLAWSLLNLGGHLAWNGDDAGIEMTREAVQMYRETPTRDVSELGFALTSFGRILMLHDSDEALPVFEEAIEVYEQGRVSPGHLRSPRMNLAEFCERRGDLERAMKLLEKVLEGDVASRGQGHKGLQELRERIEAIRLRL